jgi:hypothetical protein
MASTYVNDLRLNEMATGDASGSWGTVTNTNLELIGEAFSYGTETIGDADSTLTIADGAADAARSFYLKITSSVDLTTTRIVTLGPNTVSKVWMIENATTGSQVITIKQGSGATINVPNGQVKMISTDGAGSGGAVLDLLVDVDLTGTTTLVNLDVSGAVDIAGDLTLSAGGDGALRFTAASSVKVLDNNAAALVFEEADNAYMTFVTTDGSEAVKFDKALDINAATQIDATVTVGVDDTGYDVKFFGATAGAYMLWDESADDLILGGAAGLSVNSTALVTGVLTTTAATVSNGGGQFNGAINVGVDDTGYDVKFFGATAGKYMLWDESADTLEVSGTVVAAAGTALLPSITTTGDLNTGIFFPAADGLGFSTGGTEAMRIDSSQRVLIGATSTRTVDGYNQHLLLEGAGITKSSFAMVTHTNDANGAYFYLSKARGTTIGGSTIVQDGDVSGAIVFTAADGTDMTSKVAQIQANVDGTPNDTPGSLQFYTTADGASSVTERMRIDDNGNVRINNGAGANFTVDDDNSRSLTVAAASNANAMYVAHSSGRGVGYFGYDGGGDRLIIACDNGSGSNSIQFSVNAGSSSDTNNVDGIAAAMTIDSSGRLGLGITPSATTAFTVFQNKYLSLYGFDQAQSHILTNTYYPVDNGDYKRQATGHALKLSMNSGSYIFNIGASGAADSVIAFNQAMTLDSSGNLLVGTTVARTGTASITIEGGNSYQQFRAAGTSSLQQVSFYRNTAVTPVEVGAISTTGTATTYATSSDYRLKTDAQPMTGASDRVLALKPVNFEWISDGSRVDGFLAHEAQEVVPECVTGTKDAMRDEDYEVTAAVLDADGRVVTEAVMGTRSVPDMQGIDQSKLVPLLTAALQEALTEISALKARVTALENA